MAQLVLMRLGFQEHTSDLKTESRIIPIAKRIGTRSIGFAEISRLLSGSVPRCLRRGSLSVKH